MKALDKLSLACTRIARWPAARDDGERTVLYETPSRTLPLYTAHRTSPVVLVTKADAIGKTRGRAKVWQRVFR